jgi:hypothetical protein
MITRKNVRTMFVLAAVLTLVVAIPAWARGPSRAGFGVGHMLRPGGPKPVAPPPRGLLGQLIYPCPAACFNTAKTCYEGADTDALACISAACATAIQTAQAACATDRRSEACRDAVSDLATCSDSCLDTRETTVRACREALNDCRAACDSAE